jgi:hypothetical protein
MPLSVAELNAMEAPMYQNRLSFYPAEIVDLFAQEGWWMPTQVRTILRNGFTIELTSYNRQFGGMTFVATCDEMFPHGGLVIRDAETPAVAWSFLCTIADAWKLGQQVGTQNAIGAVANFQKTSMADWTLPPCTND